MKRTPSVALRHLLVIAGLALAGSTSGLFAASADTYYVNDHLATTTAVADAAGEIAALEADAFGAPMSDVGQAARYTGKPYDADMGAYVFPFRNYRSEEARWMSGDPSGFPDGVNGNAYSPNPLMGLDPLGLNAVDVDKSFSYSWSPSWAIVGGSHTFDATFRVTADVNNSSLTIGTPTLKLYSGGGWTSSTNPTTGSYRSIAGVEYGSLSLTSTNSGKNWITQTYSVDVWVMEADFHWESVSASQQILTSFSTKDGFTLSASQTAQKGWVQTGGTPKLGTKTLTFSFTASKE